MNENNNKKTPKQKKTKPILTEKQLKKRQVRKTRSAVAVFVLLLGVGVMGNWYYQNSDFSNDIKPLINNSESKTLGEAEFVDATTEINKDNQSTYFSKARIERQNARDEAIDSLKDSIESMSENDEARIKAEEKIADITNSITIENKIETLVTAKGIENCIAIINNDNSKIDIIVDCKELSDSLIMQIKDIAMEQLQCEFKDISIIQADGN